tara:strand:- start:560 stop:952 length:393 start_codon:yes stop_codon:yes gene_type:complete
MMMNPNMTKGLGQLIASLFGMDPGSKFRDVQNIAFDPKFREVDLAEMLSGEEAGAAPLVPVEIQELEKAESGKPNILLDEEGFPILRDEDSMQSEFENPYIITPGGGRPEPQQPADMDIRDLLNMLFNRG